MQACSFFCAVADCRPLLWPPAADTEEGPVLNDDAFLRLARAAGLSQLGGGLSDGQLGAIFQTTANAFTGCISASQFRVALGLVAAAAGVEAEEALARAADAPLPAAPPAATAAARRTGSQASPSTLQRSAVPVESAMAAVDEEAAFDEEASVAEEVDVAEALIAEEAALAEAVAVAEAAVAEEAALAEEAAVPAALESVDAVDVELAVEAQPAEAP